MNSTYCGVFSKVTVLPSLLVKVIPVMLSVSSDSWSFAVLDARRVTDVFPCKAVPVAVPLPPHPVMKFATKTVQNVNGKNGKAGNRDEQVGMHNSGASK
jgi:hypothetical protein